jgi:hypothetical protein
MSSHGHGSELPLSWNVKPDLKRVVNPGNGRPSTRSHTHPPLSECGEVTGRRAWRG